MAGDIGVVGAHAQIGLERAGVAQQREGRAALGGAAVAAREHMRGDAEAVEFDGAAQARRACRQSRDRRGGQSRARRPAAPGAPKHRRRRRPRFAGRRTPRSRRRFPPFRRRRYRDSRAPSPAPAPARSRRSDAAASATPLGGALVLDHAVENGDNRQGRDHHGRDRNAKAHRPCSDPAHGQHRPAPRTARPARRRPMPAASEASNSTVTNELSMLGFRSPCPGS